MGRFTNLIRSLLVQDYMDSILRLLCCRKGKDVIVLECDNSPFKRNLLN